MEQHESVTAAPTGKKAEMVKMKRWGTARVLTIMVMILGAPATMWFTGCVDQNAGDGDKSELLIASTISTRDSGLFDVLLPAFEQAFPAYKTKVNAVGTGEAMKLGEKCDADVLLVHAPDAEKKFVADGFGTSRKMVMYNDFVIVGPRENPARIDSRSNVVAAFRKIADSKSDFVSRSDDSGTNKAEFKLWDKTMLGKPSGDWYKEIGQGMGEALRISNETGAYTLSDRGTWLSEKDELPDLAIILEAGCKQCPQAVGRRSPAAGPGRACA